MVVATIPITTRGTETEVNIKVTSNLAVASNEGLLVSIGEVE
jgi:hypothetical protein